MRIRRLLPLWCLGVAGSDIHFLLAQQPPCCRGSLPSSSHGADRMTPFVFPPIFHPQSCSFSHLCFCTFLCDCKTRLTFFGLP